MTSLKENYQQYTTEYLLTKRALGEELSGEAHKAIEELLTERGDRFPPIPSRPIYMSEQISQQSRRSSLGKKFAISIFVVVALFVGQMVQSALKQPSFLGLVIAGAIFFVWAFGNFKKSKLNDADRDALDRAEKAHADGLTELMVASAEGDLRRVVELLDYGAQIDALSNNGSTALLYAARNNRTSVVKVLLERGANLHRENNQGDTALTIARRFDCMDVVDFLNQVASGTRDSRGFSVPGD